MRGVSRTTGVAGVLALALTAAACGTGDGGSSDETDPVVAKGCQPQNPLVPGDTGESCGHDILELFVSGLYRNDAETTEPEPDLAESVTTEDNQNFTVKIVEGATFHDGTEVKAHNFVDAWNYTSYEPNAQYLSYFFAPIEGYADLQCEEHDEDGACVGEPAASEMSGLEVVDDYTFTVRTSEKVSNLPVRFGYSAFGPLPDLFFEDREAYDEKPVGAGPYQIDSWDPKQQATLVKYDDYGGQGPAGNVESIRFEIYDDEQAAYNDLLAGNLDTLDNLPSSAMVDSVFKEELGDNWAQDPYPAIQTITFAPEDVSPEYADPRIRKAISMAIDRQKVIDDQFDGARVPADSWGAPGLKGFTAGTCGEFCEYDPEAAKALLEEAGGFDGTMTIGYNADSDHKAWVEATCNSIREALEVDCVGNPTPDFATFRDQIGKGEMEGMFRSGWLLDYPHIENFLTPLYATGASSNDGNYSNEEFDNLLVEAAAAEGDESLALYRQAEELLAEDMPAIPMWYYTATIGWSDDVENVRINKSSGRPDLLALTKK